MRGEAAGSSQVMTLRRSSCARLAQPAVDPAGLLVVNARRQPPGVTATAMAPRIAAF
jgi:hypothetical protein